MNITNNLISNIDGMINNIKEEDIKQAKMCLLDYLSVKECGKVLARDAILKYKNSIDHKNSLKDQAFLYGYCGHFLELDDGHRKAMSHPGVTVMSSLLPVAAELGIRPENIIKGIIAGYEYSLRLGCSIQPGHKKKGFHTSATCGTFGGAMAVAYSAGYDHDTKKRILSAAVSATGGTLALQDDDSEMKPLNPAIASMNAVLAVQTGNMGLSSPLDPIGGDRGFLNLYADSFDESYFKENYEDVPMIRTIYRKVHASCRHSHSPVDAALDLMQSNNIEPENIRKVIVETYDLGIKGHDEQICSNANAAKLSTPFCVASALLFGKTGIEQFEKKALENKQTSKLARRVFVTEKKEFTDALPDKRGARVIIEMNDECVYNKKVERPKGEPENPLSYDELEDKATSLLRRAGYDDRQTKEFLNAVNELDMKTLFTLMGR